MTTSARRRPRPARTASRGPRPVPLLGLLFPDPAPSAPLPHRATGGDPAARVALHPALELFDGRDLAHVGRCGGCGEAVLDTGRDGVPAWSHADRDLDPAC